MKRAAIGHPAQLSGREEVVHYVTWFVGAVENFRFVGYYEYEILWPTRALDVLLYTAGECR